MFKQFILGLLLTGLAGSTLAFDLVDNQGRHHSLSQYKGKWVLVNFWATWCPPCRMEIPDLISLTKHNAKNLVVLGIAMDYRDPDQVSRFAAEEGINYPIILGDDEVVAQIGAVNGLPTTYLYNPQGKMVAYNVGAISREAVENYMAAKGKPSR